MKHATIFLFTLFSRSASDLKTRHLSSFLFPLLISNERLGFGSRAALIVIDFFWALKPRTKVVISMVRYQ